MEVIRENPALLNTITPVGLEFQKNQLSIGENVGKIYGIIRYPQTVESEWLSKITNIPSTIVSIGFNPVDLFFYCSFIIGYTFLCLTCSYFKVTMFRSVSFSTLNLRICCNTRKTSSRLSRCLNFPV